MPLQLRIALGIAALLVSVCPNTIVSADERTSAAVVKLAGITPTGDNVDVPSQIVFQFSAPVVPLGRMERNQGDIAIEISPPLSCQWRWMNTSALMCILGERDRPKSATRYSIRVPKEFDRTRGEALDREYAESFVTTRPSVIAWLSVWSSPGRPVLGLATNQKISAEALSAHLVLEDSNHRSYPVTLEPAQESEGAPASEMEEGVRTSSADPRWSELNWKVVPTEELPLDTAMTLKSIPGLVSMAGPEPTVEETALLSFQTFPTFEFLGLGCFDTKGDPVDILMVDAPDRRKRKLSACDPLNAISLLFNSPVMRENAKTALRVSPDLTGGRSDIDPWQDVTSYSQLSFSHTKGQRYGVYLPYGLKANTSYSIAGSGAGIKDEFGRTLGKDLSVAFTTGNRVPRYVLDNQLSVLEKEVDSKLPLIVNNIDSVKLSYQAMTSSSNVSGRTASITPYKVANLAYAHPIDIREYLGGRSGVIQGSLSTVPKTSNGDTWFFSQVTPFAVHAKIGHFSSAVWVTSFATGQPISDARVSIAVNNMSRLSKSAGELAFAATDASGIARLPGTKTLDPKLANSDEWGYDRPRLFVTVEKDGEIAVVPLAWDFKVYSEGSYSYSTKEFEHSRAWGTTAQGIYKAGDTVQFSLWVRDQNDTTLTASPRGTYKLEVIDPLGKVVFTVPAITLSEFGSYAGSFTTAQNTAVGWYSFSLSSNYRDEKWEPLRVLISDFTPASFSVSSRVGGEVFRPGDAVTVNTEARLHAGGPYSDAGARVTALLRPVRFEPGDPRFASFSFDSAEESDQEIYRKEEKVNARGDLTSQFSVPSSEIPYGRIVVESAVRDDRGKFVSSVATAKFIGRGRYVGVEQRDWLLTAGKESAVQGIVVDGNGAPIVGAPFTVTIERETTKAVRVKSAGNAYITRYDNSWEKVLECSLTAAQDPVSCRFTPAGAGQYRITARVRDEKGVEHAVETTRWCSGSDVVLWNSGANTELRIVPEKKSYAVGETARFLIQNPFPGAQALITTERYGIQTARTQVLQNSSEVVELPITKDHIPGVFLSATIVSPRVAKPVEGTVDLGKPTFRMGYARVDVMDPAKKLNVDVSAEKDIYRPRETVSLSISGSSRYGATPPLEYAVSVLDEAVFDMIAGRERYFDPYAGFYTLSNLDVRNFNIMRMLVGLQKFEKKGANAGGDGGKTLDMGSLRRYVSYWNPAVQADANGRATVSFEAPDALTGWKVLVMAFTKEDQMGLGVGSFKVNKMTETRAALPNQARMGDSFTGVFTVMNRSETARKVQVEARVSGAASATPVTMTIEAEPFKRYPVAIEAKAERQGLAVFSISAGDDSDRDSIRENVTVLPRVSLETAANFGSSDGKEVTERIELPADIDPRVGSVGVVLSPTVLGGLEGAFAYMRDYPYSCWEQKLSKAVMAANFIALKGYLPKSFEWQGADELVRDTLSQITAHQATNGGMAFFRASDEYVNPYVSAYTATALGWLRELGYTIPEEPERKLREYLLGMLKNEEFQSFLSPGERASIRGAIVAALAKGGYLSIEDLARFTPVVNQMNLFGKAHYLLAAALLPEARSQQSSALTRILASSQQSAAALTFSESGESLSGYALDSPSRGSCAALEAFLYLAQSKNRSVRERVTPLIPKLAQSIAQDTLRHGRWSNTQENVFCVTALTHYSRAFEQRHAPTSLTVRVGESNLATVGFTRASGEPMEVSRALSEAGVSGAGSITISPAGKGRFYYTTRVSYSPRDLKQTGTNSGLELTREYSVERGGAWTLLRFPMEVKQGELVRVDLFLRVPAPRSYVVVDDAVPGGLEPVNRDLATASALDAAKQENAAPQGSMWHDGSRWTEFGTSFWGFYHKELRHEAARFYSEYLPSGNYHLSYVSQVIAPGQFVALPARAEEMYNPEVFGTSAPSVMGVSSTR